MPFKPMGHKNPSGDLVTGTELFNHLSEKKYAIELASRLRCRWIYYRPQIWPQYIAEKRRIIKKYQDRKPDIWLSYHSYYKAPDLLGSSCSRALDTPYVIFQGIYSTKRRKKLKTLPGFLLNRKVLQSAAQIITNKITNHNNGLFKSTTKRLDSSTNHIYNVVRIVIPINWIATRLKKPFQLKFGAILNLFFSTRNSTNKTYTNPKKPIHNFSHIAY